MSLLRSRRSPAHRIHGAIAGYGRTGGSRRDAWLRVMQQAIAINALFFNTHRMVRQYADHAYATQNGEARAG